jgi:ubiquinone/menaquinone biosynthesis C-methylase UbiE
MSLFTSTAEFYGAYRSGVPDAVAEILSDAAPSGSPRRLLDVGTGTGFVIRALLPFFDEAIGIDSDEALLAVAERDLRRNVSSGEVQLIRAAAESFTLPTEWQAHLITVCRAFHWFDRPRFLANATPYLGRGGTLAIFGDLSVWAANSQWKAATIEVVQEFLGPDRRAGNGHYQRPNRDFADDLRAAGYDKIQQQVVPVERSRSIDSVIRLSPLDIFRIAC